MAVSGMKSYLSAISNNNLYRSRSYTTNMLAKAYQMAAKSGGSSGTASAMANAIMNDKTQGNGALLEEITGKTAADKANKADLRKNAAGLFTDTAELMSGSRKSDEEFISGVKEFAESYNKTIRTLQKSNDGLAVSSGIDMTNITNSNLVALKKAGFSIEDDNTLSVDETRMKNNMDYARSLFDGNYSYGSKIAKKASDLQSIAAFSGTGIYNRFGIFASE
ncbi:MAG: hypothetical protein ACI4KF_13185 [Huintestinicola sp.]